MNHELHSPIFHDPESLKKKQKLDELELPVKIFETKLATVKTPREEDVIRKKIVEYLDSNNRRQEIQKLKDELSL
jgi:hypothetical protein